MQRLTKRNRSAPPLKHNKHSHTSSWVKCNLTVQLYKLRAVKTASTGTCYNLRWGEGQTLLTWAEINTGKPALIKSSSTARSRKPSEFPRPSVWVAVHNEAAGFSLIEIVKEITMSLQDDRPVRSVSAFCSLFHAVGSQDGTAHKWKTFNILILNGAFLFLCSVDYIL